MSSSAPAPWRRAVRYLQLAVAIAAFAYVISLIDPGDARQILAAANLYLAPVAVAVSLTGLLFAGLRWLTLLRPLGINYGPAAALRCYLAGTFYGLAMPGVVGGDVARVLICQRDTGGSIGLITASVFLERCLGVAVLLCILSIGLNATALQLVSPQIKFGIVALATATLIVAFSTPWICRRASRGLDIDVPGTGRTLQGRLRRLLPVAGKFHAGNVLLALGLSALFQLADLLCTFVVAIALGIELGISALLVALPLAYLVTALPISPAGLGVREAAFAFTLSHFGVSASDAALLALGAFSVRLAVGMLGGAQQLARGALRVTRPEHWSSS